MSIRADYLGMLENAGVPLENNQRIADLFAGGPYFSAPMHPVRSEGAGLQEGIIDTLKTMCPEPRTPPLSLHHAFNTSSPCILPDAPDPVVSPVPLLPKNGK